MSNLFYTFITILPSGFDVLSQPSLVRKIAGLA